MTRPFQPNDHVVIIRCLDGHNVGKQLRLVSLYKPGFWWAEALEPMFDYEQGIKVPAGLIGSIEERCIRLLRDPDHDETPTEIIKELMA